MLAESSTAVPVAPVVSAVAAAVQAVVVVLAASVALRQLRETRRARNVAAFFPLFNELNSADAAARRRSLHRDVKGPPESYSDTQEDIVNGIVNQFDYLGFLVANRLLEERLVVAFYYGTLIRAWRSASPYVAYQRRLRGTAFAGYFEQLAAKANQYVEKNYPALDIRRFRGLTLELPPADDADHGL